MGAKTCRVNNPYVMLLKTLTKNPLGGEQKPWKPWYGYFFLVVLVVSGGLYVYQRVNGGPAVPTFTDPATVYMNAKAVRERQELAVAAKEEAMNAALNDVAQNALALLEEAPMVLPDMENFSGDALELAVWIEQIDNTLRATVVEDPSAEEIDTYLAQNIPVLIPVIPEDGAVQRWGILDSALPSAEREIIIGNRIVIVQRT